MIVGIKDTVKLFGISIIVCCAVFVCALFLNYNADIAEIANLITSEEAVAMYNAQISMGKVTCAVTGGCLAVTSLIMLVFYVKNFVDSHGKELGILKAQGYSEIKLSVRFWVFGLSVLIGAGIGFALAFVYMPKFYSAQNGKGLFPDFSPSFNLLLFLSLTVLPTAFFALSSVIYAGFKLRMPAIDLIKDRRANKTVKKPKDDEKASFIKSLKRNTLKSKKTLVFLVGFSAFCFSAMTQMPISMKKLTDGNTFALMILSIGLILAFLTLILSLSAVLKANVKSFALMRIFGYTVSDCGKAVFGGYRPVSYIGFVLGTLYQYGLLKIIMTFIFNNLGVTYSFDFAALGISAAAFLIFYELILFLYSYKIKNLPIKCVMEE